MLVLIAGAVPLVLAACTSKPAKQAAKQVAKEAGPPSLFVTPAANTRNVPVSAEISAAVTGGKITDVSRTDDKGVKVPGAMRTDGSAWLPNKPLKCQQVQTTASVQNNT